jgi:hypothetical protein
MYLHPPAGDAQREQAVALLPALVRKSGVQAGRGGRRVLPITLGPYAGQLQRVWHACRCLPLAHYLPGGKARLPSL